MEKIELTGEYSDFIGSYSCAYNSEFCSEVINAFDYYTSMDAVYCEDGQFENCNAGRFDYAIDMQDMTPTMKGEPLLTLNQTLQNSLDEYTRVFGHLKTVPMYSCVQKVQMTPAGGGYHVWHDENSSLSHSNRCLVWMIYLNDDFEGGETEFLYQNRREEAVAGDVLIFPAGFTHTHRGNPPIGGHKYLITSWGYMQG